MLDRTTGAGTRADRRLREEQVAWLTTLRSDGQPHSVPVWFVWDGEGFLIYSQPNRQKLKNDARNPKVGLHLNSDDRGDALVRVAGRAEVPDGYPPADRVPEYVEKYRGSITRIGYDPEGRALANSVALRITPERWQVW